MSPTPRLPLAGALTLTLLLSACASSDVQYGKNPDTTNYGAPLEQAAESERAYQTQQLYGPVSHTNKKLAYSRVLSNEVAALNGVNTAIVMTTDQNAYVAIMIDNSATGTKRTGKETNNQGTNVGIYNVEKPLDDTMSSDKLNNGANNYETAVHHDLLTHRFKQTIAERIRMMQPQLLDVYISANRDFVNTMNNYAQESWKGQSLAPHLPQFNQLVEQVFGTAQLLPKP